MLDEVTTRPSNALYNPLRDPPPGENKTTSVAIDVLEMADYELEFEERPLHNRTSSIIFDAVAYARTVERDEFLLRLAAIVMAIAIPGSIILDSILGYDNP